MANTIDASLCPEEIGSSLHEKEAVRPESKSCRKCRIEKPLDGFFRAAHLKGGRDTMCRLCWADYYQELLVRRREGTIVYRDASKHSYAPEYQPWSAMKARVMRPSHH